VAKSARVNPRSGYPPGPYWYFLPVFILLLGWGTMEEILYAGRDETSGMIRVVVPGRTELALNERGTYTIFHEYRSVVDGRRYDVPGVSGLIIDLRTQERDEPIALKGASGQSYDTGDVAGRSLFEFDVLTPGTYRLTSSYGDSRKEPQTVLAIARGFVQGRARTTLVAEITALGSIALAALIALVLFAKRRASMRRT
jgi:hypothetical protein